MLAASCWCLAMKSFTESIAFSLPAIDCSVLVALAVKHGTASATLAATAAMLHQRRFRNILPQPVVGLALLASVYVVLPRALVPLLSCVYLKELKLGFLILFKSSRSPTIASDASEIQEYSWFQLLRVMSTILN